MVTYKFKIIINDIPIQEALWEGKEDYSILKVWDKVDGLVKEKLEDFKDIEEFYKTKKLW